MIFIRKTGVGKYKAKRVSHAGLSFASKGEGGLYDYLKLLELNGEIRDIEPQSYVYLTDARIGMIPDFKVFDVKIEGPAWYEYKGFETPEYRLKRKLWTVYGPGPLRVFKGYGQSLKMVEEIYPRATLKK